MAFGLGDIKDWQEGLSCTPTALSALSGKATTEIAALLQDEARKHGRVSIWGRSRITRSALATDNVPLGRTAPRLGRAPWRSSIIWSLFYSDPVSSFFTLTPFPPAFLLCISAAGSCWQGRFTISSASRPAADRSKRSIAISARACSRADRPPRQHGRDMLSLASDAVSSLAWETAASP